MYRVCPFIVGLLIAATANPQDTRQRLAFEVATVKAAAPLDLASVRNGQAHIGTRIDAGRVDIGTAPLFRLICAAYDVAPYRVKGPDWLKSTNFDIQAKFPDGAAAAQLPKMLQTLLEDRFGLQMHRENIDQPVYALVVAKGGAKLKAAAAPVEQPASQEPPQRSDTISIPTIQGIVKLVGTAQGISMEMPDGEITGKASVSMNSNQPPSFHIHVAGASMKMFAALLSVGVLDRPVVDMTGVAGTYDVAVDLSADDARRIMTASTDFMDNM